jgi:hypothetical protein
MCSGVLSQAGGNARDRPKPAGNGGEQRGQLFYHGVARVWPPGTVQEAFSTVGVNICRGFANIALETGLRWPLPRADAMSVLPSPIRTGLGFACTGGDVDLAVGAGVAAVLSWLDGSRRWHGRRCR